MKDSAKSYRNSGGMAGTDSLRRALKSEQGTQSERLTAEVLLKEYIPSAGAWERVQIARNPDRPNASDYIRALFTDFTELHGDRCFGDDKSVIGGVAFFEGRPVTLIGIQKGKNTEENILRNFGMAHPEGYRKALRLMKQAEKFHRPIITWIDTPGAYPGIGAEERGQAEAIASNLAEMMCLKVPIISIVIGEGGSGGALALGVGNQVWMLENAVYSILSPEGFAAILYKDAAKAPEVTESMKMTGDFLLEMGVVDFLFSEGKDGIIKEFPRLCEDIRIKLRETLDYYAKKRGTNLERLRYKRFRDFGKLDESS